MDNKQALHVYTRASIFNDFDLASACFGKAALVPPHKLSIDILRQIPASALSALVCAVPMAVCTLLTGLLDDEAFAESEIYTR